MMDFVKLALFSTPQTEIKFQFFLGKVFSICNFHAEPSSETIFMFFFAFQLKKAAGNVESVRSLIVKQEEGILSRAKNLHQKLDDLEKAARSGKKSTSVLRKKVREFNFL
jgi:hypothetical protein